MEQKKAIQKMHDYYAMKPDAPVYKRDLGFYVLDRWIGEGYLKPRNQELDYDAYLRKMFRYDEPAFHDLYGAGICEAEFFPRFEEKVLEDRGEHEVIQDYAGRAVLVFKGRRDGFMPEYLDHPVKDQRTWEENVKWRLDPNTPGRMEQEQKRALRAKKDQDKGHAVRQMVVGGYMYLRSLIGPTELLFKFYDEPELIHACMQEWLTLTDAIVAEHQKIVEFDEIYMDEDICYNKGSLISPDMMREFLFPYYQQLLDSAKKRNHGRKLRFMLDTDGRADDVIDLYKEVGMDGMCPFEVASGCDVVKLSQKYPELLMMGGIDKRIITEGGDALKRHLDYIMPAMRRRGGYIPTCDHGVPEETPFENFMLYRSLMEDYCN